MLKRFTHSPINVSPYETKYIPIVDVKSLPYGVYYHVKEKAYHSHNELNEELHLIKSIIDKSNGVYMRTSSGIIFAPKKTNIVVANEKYETVVTIETIDF